VYFDTLLIDVYESIWVISLLLICFLFFYHLRLIIFVLFLPLLVTFMQRFHDLVILYFSRIAANSVSRKSACLGMVLCYIVS